MHNPGRANRGSDATKRWATRETSGRSPLRRFAAPAGYSVRTSRWTFAAPSAEARTK